MNHSLVKSTSESLNIEVKDGKPRFRLNEPTFSGVNIPSYSNLECDNDECSFVVLGKNSFDFINDSLLIDYDQIEEKSMTTDHNSIILPLSHEEIETKVAELLQENIKLKETLTQNNKAMKCQFKKLVSWQEELMKVHGNHKQKFAETRNMITLLQKENTELKTKLAFTNSVKESQFSGEPIEESNNKKQECLQNQMQSLISIQTVNANTNIKSTETDSVDVFENTSDDKLKKLLKLSECQDRDLQYRQEIISSLKAQLQTLIEYSFKPIELQMGNSITAHINTNRQQFLDNVIYYNEKFGSLVKCFAEQTSRFTNIQDCLNRCINVLTTININPSSEIHKVPEKILNECRKQLIQEQIQNITERQSFLTVQNQFQKIFSDYNSILHELEISREEYEKPIDKSNNLEREREELKMKMKILENEKHELELTKQKLIEEQNIFEQQQANLEQAKASLNSQSMLYENEMKNLQENMKIMHIHQDDMLASCAKYKEELCQKNIELEGLKARLEIAKNDAETITILRHHLEVYKNDFNEEQIAKQNLIREREHLSEELGKIREFNQQLLCKIHGPNRAPIPQEDTDEELASRLCVSCGLYTMPGQWHGPGFCHPID